MSLLQEALTTGIIRKSLEPLSGQMWQEGLSRCPQTRTQARMSSCFRSHWLMVVFTCCQGIWLCDICPDPRGTSSKLSHPLSK